MFSYLRVAVGMEQYEGIQFSKNLNVMTIRYLCFNAHLLKQQGRSLPKELWNQKYQPFWRIYKCIDTLETEVIDNVKGDLST